REHGLLPLFHRATTGACSHVRVDGTGDLCLHGDLCDSLRILLVLPSGTFHCRCSLTRSQGDFQFLEVSTSRWGTRYVADWKGYLAMPVRRMKDGRWRYRVVVDLPSGKQVRISGSAPRYNNTKDAAKQAEKDHILRAIAEAEAAMKAP